MTERPFQGRPPSPYQARPLPCERCGGASGHEPIPARSSVPSETLLRGVRISPRERRVCRVCVIRLGREARNWEAVQEATVARRLLELSHQSTSSYRRHAVEHQAYVAACRFCRWDEAER